MNQALGADVLERALAERTEANRTLLRGRGGAARAALPPDGGALRPRRPPDRARPVAGRALGRPPRRGRVRAPGDRGQAGAAGARPDRGGRPAGDAGASWRSSPTTWRSRSGTARRGRRGARERGCLTHRVRARRARSGSSSRRPEDASIRQELVETLYHVLWELVHVFFDHRGLLEGRAARQLHDPGASSFLYPFLGEQEHDLGAVVEDVRRSVLAKSREVGDLRAQTLGENGCRLGGRRREPARRPRRGRAHARARQRRLRHRRDGRRGGLSLIRRTRAGPRAAALDLTEDAAILTAIANDIGTEAIFSRQVIAHGRAGDTLLAISTSGNSANVIAALEEARRRGLSTIAMVGYDGGRVASRGPCGTRDRHALGAHPAHPGGPGERVPRAAGAGRLSRVRARVEGTVQGVGFRPYVYRLAGELGVAGHVLNDSRGVVVEVEAPPRRWIASSRGWWLRRRRWRASSAWSRSLYEETGQRASRFARARRGGEPRAAVTPDSATCADCLAELFDPADRRFRYPFINCTNCGPRFTIVRDIPYDRPNTTMAGFAMCPVCRGEYDDPADRRFHAQPNACPACGPSLRLLPAAADPLAGAVRALLDGAIVAVKGLGGFHLACLARRRAGGRAAARAQAPRGQAVRADGARSGRPPACSSSSTRRPRSCCSRASGRSCWLRAGRTPRWHGPRSPASRELGVMLPYSPLHHLLLADAGQPLVMTSGNVSDEPIAYRDEDAQERLSGIADVFLLHDRPIETRTDDSVVRVAGGPPAAAAQVARLRAGRACAPRRGGGTAAGVRRGAQEHLCRGEGRARVGGPPHRRPRRTRRRSAPSRRASPTSSGCSRSSRPWSPTICTPSTCRPSTRSELTGCASSGCSTITRIWRPASRSTARPARPSGAIFDGTGYGGDGTVWGGELLLGDLRGFERAGPALAGAAAGRRSGGQAALADGVRLAVRGARRRRRSSRRASTVWSTRRPGSRCASSRARGSPRR